MKLWRLTTWLTVVMLSVTFPAHAWELTATVSGLFRDADTGQFHSTTLDIRAEAQEPTGAWEFVADEEYDVVVTLQDTEAQRVRKVTIRDPEGEIVDQATADPPVSALTASGSFRAVRTCPVDWESGLTGKWDGVNGLSVELFIKATWEPPPPPSSPPPPDPTVLIVGVRDMTQGPPGVVPGSAIVEIWPVGEPQNKDWTTIDWDGNAAFYSMDPGEYTVRVIGMGPDGACDYEFDSVVVIHTTTVEYARVWIHWPIGGKVWFKDELGQVIPGNPYGVTLVLLEDGEPVENADAMVGTTQNQDGSYTYSVQPVAGSLPVGDFVLRATYQGTTLNNNVTYPNDCAQVLPQDYFTHVGPGAHSQVDGGDFTFIIEEEPPPEP